MPRPSRKITASASQTHRIRASNFPLPHCKLSASCDEPPPPPVRRASLRLSAENMVSVANGGAVTPSGALRHYLQRPQPRSSLSLRVDCAELAPAAMTPDAVSCGVRTPRQSARNCPPAVSPPDLFDF
ncbi:unnamed protein product, partial [Iphiclides podalirius]